MPLADLEARLARDLAQLGLPRAPWVTPHQAPDGTAMLDVLVIGAGQYGIGAAAALQLSGIRNILVIDRAGAGVEGPWVTYARMPTLRSPKHLAGPCLGLAALTFQSWYRAARGDAAWEALSKIPNADWQAYILWLRRVLGLPVQNGVEAVGLEVCETHVTVQLASGGRLHARRLVVATGRAACGGWVTPAAIAPALGPDLLAHSAQPIDFPALRGKRVAILGVGSSAFDNAATALEAGAASVTMLARRRALPQLNKGRPSASIGFLDGWQALPDAERWRLACYLDAMQGVPPHETLLRALATPGLSVHFETRLVAAEAVDGRVRLALENGPSGDYDFLILGTGFRVDLAAEPLFAGIAPHILRWADAYRPPPALARPHLAAYPYIGPDFGLIAREGPALGRIHLFNAATWVSAGALTLDIPGLDLAPGRLAVALTQALFAEDFEAQFQALQEWQEEHELAPTPFYAPDFVNRTGR